MLFIASAYGESLRFSIRFSTAFRICTSLLLLPNNFLALQYSMMKQQLKLFRRVTTSSATHALRCLIFDNRYGFRKSIQDELADQSNDELTKRIKLQSEFTPPKKILDSYYIWISDMPVSKEASCTQFSLSFAQH